MNEEFRSFWEDFVGAFSQQKYHGWDHQQLSKLRIYAEQLLEMKLVQK